MNKGCNCAEFTAMVDRLFHVVFLTEGPWAAAVEAVRAYLVDGGEECVADYLQLGIQERIRDGKVLRRRIVYLDAERDGQELTPEEIRSIGQYLPGGQKRHVIESLTENPVSPMRAYAARHHLICGDAEMEEKQREKEKREGESD